MGQHILMLWQPTKSIFDICSYQTIDFAKGIVVDETDLLQLVRSVKITQ